MGKVVGIDLGTTFSVIAYVEDDGTPRVIPNLEGTSTTPSVVLIDGERILVGAPAVNELKFTPEQVCELIKRAMGDRDYRFNGESAPEISAEILRKLKEDAEAELGEEVARAVITCPAYFGAIEREETKRAGELAGLEVQEIVQEPVAAAVYWGVSNLADGERVMVCDLGGGTFDATVLRFENGRFTPEGTGGDRELGGSDWTAKLVGHVADEIRHRRGENPLNDMATNQQLYEACEAAKKNLSDVNTVMVHCSLGDKVESVEVSREEFESITEGLLMQVVESTEDALRKKAGLTWDDIQHVLPVGGATKMPAVIRALREASGIAPVDIGAKAHTVVALGAAVMAEGKMRRPRSGIAAAEPSERSVMQPVSVDRRSVRDLGTRVVVWHDDGPAIENTAIVQHGSSLPAEETCTFHTSINNQQHFDVPVVEFDDVGPDVIVDTWRFTGLPDCDKDTEVDVTFKYADQSGSVDADAVCGGVDLQKVRIRYQEPDLEAMEVSVEPRHVAFVLDTSGSMDGPKIDRAKSGLTKHAREFLEAGQGSFQVALVTFSMSAEIACPMTDDPDVVRKAIEPISTFGTTAMHAGIQEAVRLLEGAPEDAVCEIALVTDGIADEPAATLDAARAATDAGIEISVLGIGEQDVDVEFIQSLTDNAFTIEGAADLEGWISGFLSAGSASGQQRSGITTWG